MIFKKYKAINLKQKNMERFCPTPIVPFPEEKYEEFYPSPAQVIYDMEVLAFTRELKTEIITVRTEPTLILSPPHPKAYLIFNPARITGGPYYQTFLVYEGTATAEGDSTADPLGVSNFEKCHVHITVSSVSGTWDFIQLVADPYTGEWAEAQTFRTIDSTGVFYNSLGDFGIATDLAFRWRPVTSGSITFSLTVTLKGGTGATDGGIERTIYLGGRDVTVETGLPLLESNKIAILPAPDIEIWAIAKVETNIRVFWL